MKGFEQLMKWNRSIMEFLDEDFWEDFGEALYYSGPRINLYQERNQIICLAAIPGLTDKKQINIYVEQHRLRITGNIQYKASKGKLVQQELYEGPFDRSIDLPYPVRTDRYEATYKRGLVSVKLFRLIPDDKHQQKVNIDIHDH